MSSDARAWLDKAKGDLDVVDRSLIPLPGVNLEAAAYHLQQAAEKALKGLLTHLELLYPRGGGKGHDISIIAAMVPMSHRLRAQAIALVPLTPWATAYRYPYDDPTMAPEPPSPPEIRRIAVQTEAFIASVVVEIDASHGNP